MTDFLVIVALAALGAALAGLLAAPDRKSVV